MDESFLPSEATALALECAVNLVSDETDGSDSDQLTICKGGSSDDDLSMPRPFDRPTENMTERVTESAAELIIGDLRIKAETTAQTKIRRLNANDTQLKAKKTVLRPQVTEGWTSVRFELLDARIANRKTLCEESTRELQKLRAECELLHEDTETLKNELDQALGRLLCIANRVI